ncbi:hypothetical protein CC1G_10247 [Coprinopsis cinerea okayama7|uniref:Uncharacterized protein n=1 Tax=Coprinopsis cinerea (strain Okayama-7 / 130 / ATCC MYA-4618 / FGSC 9003) TaxID=240176 RepID=A8NPE5_COPC7|nr:hypothetical protein CC1G_10247 [Coprinopsis cinerea okayama7\|eukprot:XP_001835320.2 hypothetical protein CC1G_10247 [Coprinopsis cinerea okayama7\
MSFCALVAAVFFGTGAGVVQRSTPYKGTSCSSRPVSAYPPQWQPYAGECARVVALQGIAWALWALYLFLLIATIIHKFEIRTRPTPEGWYFKKAKAS